tara:strand:+ start:3134 stop:3739 length:606 start_codon:yes stop_codon:yes gene_type:complete
MRTIILLTITYILSNLLFANNIFINDISFHSKENGVMIDFNLSNSMSTDSINAWQSKSNWFYFTFYNVSADSNKLMKNIELVEPISELQPIVNKYSTQIGIKLKKRIESHDIMNINKNNVISAHLHYSLDNFASLASVSKYNRDKERHFTKRFQRSKSWLMFIGSAVTISGLAKYDKKPNPELSLGLATIILTFIIDKFWS